MKKLIIAAAVILTVCLITFSVSSKNTYTKPVKVIKIKKEDFTVKNFTEERDAVATGD